MSARILIGAAAALSVAMGAQGAVYAPEVKTALDALGLRDELVVIRADTGDGDREPLFLAQGLHIPPTYFRAGEQQCMDKMAHIVACSEESADPALAQAVQLGEEPDAVTAALPDWAGTPLPAVRDGDTIWITVPAPKPLPGPGPETPVVNLSDSRWYLGGAVIAGIVVAGAVAWRKNG